MNFQKSNLIESVNKYITSESNLIDYVQFNNLNTNTKINFLYKIFSGKKNKINFRKIIQLLH
jgi:hypothetical protein